MDSCACFGDPPGSVGFIEYLVFGFSWKIVILNKEAGFLPRCDMESSCSAGAPFLSVIVGEKYPGIISSSLQAGSRRSDPR